MNVKSRYVFNDTYVDGELTYGEDTYEELGRTFENTCMTQNQHGLVGSGYWSEESDANKTLPVVSSPYGMLPAPGGSATLFTATNSLGGLTYSINHNLEHVGKLSTRTIGSGNNARKEKIWRITEIADPLKYSDGSLVRITSVGFSGNGRYMVAQLHGRGLVQINLKTKEMTPFSSNNYTSGTNYINVSNDGNYVAFARDGALIIHDLSGCEQEFGETEWPATGALPTSGCQSREVTQNIRALYPSAQQVSGLRFYPNGASLAARLFWRVNTQSFEQYILLSADDYVSDDSGYLAMGDSFSSGEGDGQGGTWYEPGTDEQGNEDTFAGRNLCHLSRRSYPYLLAVELGYLATNTISPPSNGLFHSVACSGAETRNIVGVTGEKHDDGDAIDFQVTDNQYRYDDFFTLKEWQPGYERQVGFVSGRSDDIATRDSFNPEAITLGIGGNDAGFSDKLVSCLLPGTCEFAVDDEKRAEVIWELAFEKKVLERTYRKVKEEAPDARIYVLGYPQLVSYPITACGNNTLLDEAEIRFIYETTRYFNDIIESAATAAGVIYVDVEGALAGFNLCSGVDQSDMAMNGATLGNDRGIPIGGAEGGPFDIYDRGWCILRTCIGAESFHPNQMGHEMYKEAIKQATNNLSTPNPEPAETPVPSPDEYFGIGARSYVEGLNDPEAAIESGKKLKQMIIEAPGYRKVNILIDGQLPYSKVEAWYESEPVSLGTFTVDANGRLETTLDIPTDLPGGYHEIHIKGRDTTGNEVHYYEPMMLDMSPNDFDGDGVLNDTDSCPTITNSDVDVDEDGIDDACDTEAVPAPEPEQPPQEPEPPAMPPKKESIFRKVVRAVIKIVSFLKSIFRF